MVRPVSLLDFECAKFGAHKNDQGCRPDRPQFHLSLPTVRIGAALCCLYPAKRNLPIRRHHSRDAPIRLADTVGDGRRARRACRRQHQRAGLCAALHRRLAHLRRTLVWPRHRPLHRGWRAPRPARVCTGEIVNAWFGMLRPRTFVTAAFAFPRLTTLADQEPDDRERRQGVQPPRVDK